MRPARPTRAISDQPSAISVGWLLMAGCWLLEPAVGWACPGCKEALFDPGQLAQKLSTARGYAISIGLLLAVPVALVAGTAALIVRAQRRKWRQPGC